MSIDNLKLQYSEPEEISNLRKTNPGTADLYRIYADNSLETEVKIGIESLKYMVENDTPQQVFDIIKSCYEAMIEHNKNILSPEELSKNVCEHLLQKAKNEKRL